MNRPPAEAGAHLAATEAVDREGRDESDDADGGDGIHMSYRRFAAMIATSTVLTGQVVPRSEGVPIEHQERLHGVRERL